MKKIRKFAVEELLDTFETDTALDNVEVLENGTDLDKAALVDNQPDPTPPVEDGVTPPVEGSDNEPKDPGVLEEGTQEPTSSVTPEEQAAIDADYQEKSDAVDPEAAVDTSDIEADSIPEVNEKAEASTQGAELAQALEEIADIIENSLPVGGLKAVDIPAVQTAIDTIYAGVGLEPAGVIAVESFTPSKRLRNTKMAIENIREQIKKIWARIITFLQNIVKWIDEHISKYIFKVKSNKAKLAKLKELAQNFVPKKTTQDEFYSNHIVVERLSFTGHKEKGNINDSLMQFVKIAATFYTSVFQSHERLHNMVEKSLSENINVVARTDVLIADHLLGPEWHKTDKIDGYATAGTGTALFTAGNLPNGVILAACAPIPVANDTLENQIGRMSQAEIFLANDPKYEAPQEVWEFVEDKAELLHIIEMMEQVNGVMEDSIARLHSVVISKNKILATVKAKTNKFVQNESSTNAILCNKLIMAMSNLYDKPVTNFNSQFYRFFDAAMEYTAACLKRREA